MLRNLVWTPTGRFWLDLFRLACHSLVAMVLISHAGRWIPLGDSLAVFRIELTLALVACGLVALALRRRAIPVIALAVAAFSFWSVRPFLDGAAAAPERAALTVHQHNLWFRNRNHAALRSEIAARQPDVITFQEIGSRNVALIRALAESHPHYQVCTYDTGGVAVFARDIGAKLEAGCLEDAKLAWMRIGTAQGPVTFVSIHLFWPWPRPQFVQVEDYAAAIAALPGPVVIGGDFNMVPWAASVARIAEAAGGRVVPGIAASFHLWRGLVRFRIDHVIAPEGWRMRSRALGKLGSDHNGIWAELEPLAQGALPDAR